MMTSYVHRLQKVITYIREPGWLAVGARIKCETSKIEVAILTIYLYTQTLRPYFQENSFI